MAMKLYVVKNSAGQFFRPCGMGGGTQWQTDIARAKFYTKIGTAKAQCTSWYNHNPRYGCPSLLEFSIEPENAKEISVLESAMESAAKKKRKEEEQKARAALSRQLQAADNIKKLLTVLTPEQRKQMGL